MYAEADGLEELLRRRPPIGENLCVQKFKFQSFFAFNISGKLRALLQIHLQISKREEEERKKKRDDVFCWRHDGVPQYSRVYVYVYV